MAVGRKSISDLISAPRSLAETLARDLDGSNAIALSQMFVDVVAIPTTEQHYHQEVQQRRRVRDSLSMEPSRASIGHQSDPRGSLQNAAAD